MGVLSTPCHTLRTPLCVAQPAGLSPVHAIRICGVAVPTNNLTQRSELGHVNCDVKELNVITKCTIVV